MSMQSDQRRNMWRDRCEQWLDSDMSVAEWCAANRVNQSVMFRWFGRFADTEPELFGGAGNITDRGSSKWLTKTRDNMRRSKALAVKGPSGFVRLEDADLVPDRIPDCSRGAAGEQAAASPAGMPTPIRVIIGPASVEIPPSSAKADVECVLRAVASL